MRRILDNRSHGAPFNTGTRVILGTQLGTNDNHEHLLILMAHPLRGTHMEKGYTPLDESWVNRL